MELDIFTLSHEIKNPLCVAMGYNTMLNEKNVLLYKKIIDEEIKNAINILNSYLDYQKLNINKEVIDFNCLLSDLKFNLKEYLNDKKIDLEIDMIDDEIYIDADYDKLKQVFLNLINNSIDAKSTRIKINYQINNNKLIINCFNNGIPINYNEIKNIGHNYSNKILGHGIGTTISRKIIELHNGSIVYEIKNNGTNVLITL